MPLPIATVVQQLRDCGLVAPEKLEKFLPPHAAPADGDALVAELLKQNLLSKFQAAQVVAGKSKSLVLDVYTIVDKIGAGGMGQVFKARHRRMERTVALKVMSPAAMKDEAAVKRFQREVRAAAKLEHPNIVTAYDSGEAGNVKYLVMQFVDGGDLSGLVKNGGPLPIERAVNYVLQAARGLAFAHGEGVIHRDIKPANLLLDKKGVVKILDMGLARIESGDDGLTGTEQVMGTVDYMSPEQAAQTKGVDGRADIYSLGCTLWFLLTGKKTYEADSMIARLMAHKDAPLPSLVKARDDAPWPLEQAFHKMIAKRPEDRFQTMDEVVAALEPFTAAGGVSPTGAGSSIGHGGTHDQELSAFLKGVGPASGTKPQTKPTPSKTNIEPEVTAAFVRDPDTDPKSELGMPAIGARQAVKPPLGRELGAERQAKGEGGKKPPNKTILLAGAGGAALLVLFGGFFLFRSDDEPSVGALPVAPGVTPAVPSPPVPSGSPFAVAKSTVPATAFFTGPTTSVALPSPGDYALLFDGNGEVNFDKPMDYSTDSCTIEALVRPDAFARRGAVYEVSERGRFGLDLADGKSWLMDHTLDPSGHYSALSVSPAELGRRVHVAGIYDKGDFRVYVDGKLDGRSKRMQRSFAVGRRPPSIGQFFQGLIDEVRVSKVVRYRNDFTPPPRHENDADTLALYHCDEGAGYELKDASGNNRHGLLRTVKWVKADGSAVLAAGGSTIPPATPTSFMTTATPPPPGDYALLFDGKSRVAFDKVIDYSPTACTLEAFVRPTAYARDAVVYQVSSSGRIGTSWNEGLGWYVDHYLEAGGHHYGESKTPIDVGKRIHLAGVFDKDDFRLYVDGKLIAAAPQVARRSFVASQTMPAIGDRFQGVIDDVRVSKRARYAADFTPPTRHELDADTLALYRCDEGAGFLLGDAAAGKIDGIIQGATWVNADGSPIPSASAAPPTTTPAAVPTPGDYALDFDGVDDMVEVSGIGKPFSSPLTLEVWTTPRELIKPSYVVTLGEASASRLLFKVHDRQDEWNVLAGGSEAAKYKFIGAAAQAGRRDHLAAVWTGNKLTFFLNGVPSSVDLSPELAKELSQVPLTDRLQIGGKSDAAGSISRVFSGVIDELRVSQTARYVQSFTPSPRFTPDADTLALYHFDEGTGDRLVDSSGNNRHGKITGATWVKADGSAVPAAGGSTLPPNGASVPAGIDLLPRVRIDQPAESPPWTRDTQGVVIPKQGIVRTLIDADVPDEYELHVDVTPLDGNHSLVMGVSRGGKRFWIPVSGWNKAETKIEPTPSVGSGPTTSTAFRLEANKPARLVFTVRRDRVIAEADGAVLIDWHGDSTTLTEWDLWKLPEPQKLAIGSWVGKMRVTRLELWPLPPAAEPTTSAPAKRRFASDEWIDVIPLIDPALDRFDVPKLTGKNEWRIENGELIAATDGKPNKLLFPLDLVGTSFECEVEFTRNTDGRGLNLDVPAPLGPCPMIYDRDDDGRALLGKTGIQLAGKVAIKTGERSTIRLLVRRVNGQDELETWFNGASLGKWSGNRDAITAVKQEGYPHDRRNGFWIYNDEYVFHRIRYRMLDGGTAETLRPVPPPTPAASTPNNGAAAKTLADPTFQTWLTATQALPAAEQIDQVSKKLVELNPGFDGRLTGTKGNGSPRLKDGGVDLVWFNVDRVTDISPVRAFPKLTELQLAGSAPRRSPLSDLSPLAGIKLTSLFCTDTNVVDLEPIRGMRLQSLFLTGSVVADLGPVAGMPLLILDVRRTEVRDIVPLRGIQFRDFICTSTAIADFSPLNESRSLTYLDLRKTQVTASGVTTLQQALPNCKIEWDDPAKAPAPTPNQGAAATIADPASTARRKTTKARLAAERRESAPTQSTELTPSNRDKLTGEKLNTSLMNHEVATNLRDYTDKVAGFSPIETFTRRECRACVSTKLNAERLRDLRPLDGLPLTSLTFYGKPQGDVTSLPMLASV